MKQKDLILIASAVAVALKANDSRFNPQVAAIMSMIGLGLAWWADHPRSHDGRSEDKSTDEELNRMIDNGGKE